MKKSHRLNEQQNSWIDNFDERICFYLQFVSRHFNLFSLSRFKIHDKFIFNYKKFHKTCFYLSDSFWFKSRLELHVHKNHVKFINKFNSLVRTIQLKSFESNQIWKSFKTTTFKHFREQIHNDRFWQLYQDFKSDFNKNNSIVNVQIDFLFSNHFRLRFKMLKNQN